MMTTPTEGWACAKLMFWQKRLKNSWVPLKTQLVNTFSPRLKLYYLQHRELKEPFQTTLNGKRSTYKDHTLNRLNTSLWIWEYHFKLSCCSYFYLFTLYIGKTIKCLIIDIIILLNLFIFKIHLLVSLTIFLYWHFRFLIWIILNWLCRKLEGNLSILPSS